MKKFRFKYHSPNFDRPDIVILAEDYSKATIKAEKRWDDWYSSEIWKDGKWVLIEVTPIG